MTREEKLAQLETAMADSRKLFFIIKKMFINNVDQLSDEQLDQYLAYLSEYEAPTT